MHSCVLVFSSPCSSCPLRGPVLQRAELLKTPLLAGCHLDSASRKHWWDIKGRQERRGQGTSLFSPFQSPAVATASLWLLFLLDDFPLWSQFPRIPVPARWSSSWSLVPSPPPLGSPAKSVVGILLPISELLYCTFSCSKGFYNQVFVEKVWCWGKERVRQTEREELEHIYYHM